MATTPTPVLTQLDADWVIDVSVETDLPVDAVVGTEPDIVLTEDIVGIVAVSDQAKAARQGRGSLTARRAAKQYACILVPAGTTLVVRPRYLKDGKVHEPVMGRHLFSYAPADAVVYQSDEEDAAWRAARRATRAAAKTTGSEVL
ncbi:MAG: hypothetical protein DRH08_14710 [Deltaproteobacteria bacterium]|nr:MAG: hypothetical protein DRH08_14710 [Deltaproteobacteria bacterium]